MMCIVVALLIAAATTAQINSETPVSDPVYGRAPGDQSPPVTASDGTNFLVAWFDARGLPGTIYANRVSPDGRVLDGTGIRIPPYPGASNLVGAFWAGSAYTLIYSYQLFEPTRYSTVVAQISAEGQLVTAPRVVDEEGGYTRSAASNGSRIVIVAGEHIIVLNEHAEVVERIPFATSSMYGFAAASNGATFLLGMFASKSNTVNLVALDADGRPSNMTRVSAGGMGNYPLIASDGSDYLVLYVDARSASPVALSVARDAQIRATATLATTPHSVLSGSLTWMAGSYVLATTTSDASQQLAALTLQRDGTIVGAVRPLGGPGTPGADNRPSISWNGKKALVAWTSGSQQDLDGLEVDGMLLTSDGTPASAAMTIPRSSNAQFTPAIAAGGENDLAVWSELSGIYASRVTRSGVPLDGRGLLVTSERLTSYSPLPTATAALRVIFDSPDYVVVWSTREGIKQRRIVARTGFLPGSETTLGPCPTSFDIGHDGTSNVLFAVDCSDAHLYAQRFGIAGTTGVPVPISPTGMITGAPHAAWNGHIWLVAWDELILIPTFQFQFSSYRGNVHGARLSPALTTLDAQPIAVAVTQFDENTPLVATNGTDFLVVWSRSFTAVEAMGVYVRRVHDDGSLNDTAQVLSGSFQAQSAIWDGARYAVAYASTADYSNYDLFMTHLVPDEHQPLVRDRVTISATESDERGVALAVAPSAPVRAVYTRVAPEPQYGGVSRVFIRDVIYRPRHRAVQPHS